MQTSFTPAASTLFLQLDTKISQWYGKSQGKGAKNFFERTGKALLIIPLNILEGTVGALAGLIYDLTMSVIWGLGTLFTGGKNQKCLLNFYAHLNSLGRAGSHAFNHISAAILFPFTPFTNAFTTLSSAVQEIEVAPQLFKPLCQPVIDQETSRYREWNGRLQTDNQQLQTYLDKIDLKLQGKYLNPDDGKIHYQDYDETIRQATELINNTVYQKYHIEACETIKQNLIDLHPEDDGEGSEIDKGSLNGSQISNENDIDSDNENSNENN